MSCLRGPATFIHKMISELKRPVTASVIFGAVIVGISVTGTLSGLDADGEGALEVDASLVAGDVGIKDSHSVLPARKCTVTSFGRFTDLRALRLGLAAPVDWVF